MKAGEEAKPFEHAKIGQGSMPQTSAITSYHLNNIVIWDTPGLGDSEENDKRYKEAIIQKLQEKDSNNLYLIDLVILIIDGASRDYKSAYALIKDVVAPNLGEEKSKRLLIAINQADMAMKGRHWNHEVNEPDAELVQFLEEKAKTTQERIKADTGLDIEPIYYSAGYKEGTESQNPYNLSKLLAYILDKLPSKKRISVMIDVNQNNDHFEKNDNKDNYQEKIQEDMKQSLIDNFLDTLKKGANKVTDFAKDYIESDAFKEHINVATRAIGSFLLKVVISKIKNKA